MSNHHARGIARCGLACTHCSAAECPGCHANSAQAVSECATAKCCSERGYQGCGACAGFPCDKGMFSGAKTRVFARYAHERGNQALIAQLDRNAARGITYGNTAQSDALQSKEKWTYEQTNEPIDVERRVIPGQDEEKRVTGTDESHHSVERVDEDD